MAERVQSRINGSALVSIAAFVVIVAGLRTAQGIVVPFLVATFLAVICLPPLHWLQAKGLPTWLALLVITTIVVVIGLVIMGIIGTSVNELRQQLPVYEKRVVELQDQLGERLKGWNVDLGFKFQRDDFDAQRALSLFGTVLGAVGGVLSNALIIVFTLFFMLLEAADFPAKLRAISPERDDLGPRLAKIQSSVRRYVSLKTRISLLNGVLIAAWLWLLGVDFPLLWGLLAFLLNFIPNIGSFIAGVPAVVLAFLQLNLATAAYAAAGYVALDFVIGNVIEPRIMGRGLGLSSLVVFVSLVFWGWVLGPVGMLFSVPLTMIVKIVLDNSADLRWIAILLSSDPPVEGVKAGR
jgi:AI-2 transport protein TqsA